MNEDTADPRFRVVTRNVKATQLDGDETLADGAIILRTSHQLSWFYIKAVKDGRLVRRRYRHDQLVAVQEWIPA